MNYQIATVMGLTIAATFAHVTGGLLQSLSISPVKVMPMKAGDAQREQLDRNWVQSMCAFQLVTVDLIALSVVLYLIAFTDVLMQKQLIGFSIAALYFFWGCSWLLQLFSLKRKAKDYLYLGHWVFWFVCAGLTYWGALSL